jgi:tRNA dimethylallyltransferase
MNKLLVITGPTGVGKTPFAIQIAKKIGGEIVSADSRQVYREMDIGTAKPTDQEQTLIPHHLIDLIKPNEMFSLSQYQSLAYSAIDKIIASGKKPILVGGTGLYIQAVVDGLKIPKVAANEPLRLELEGLSTDDLLDRLKKIDSDSARTIPYQNRRRLIRALEVSQSLGQPFSVISRQYHRLYDTLQIGLTAPRPELYHRADARVDQWIKEGWVDEVKQLKRKYPATLPALSGLGYRQLGMYLDGKISLEEAALRTKFDTHGYIRRQMTWFRRDGRIYWFDTSADDSWQDAVVNQVNSWYAEKEDDHGNK